MVAVLAKRVSVPVPRDGAIGLPAPAHSHRWDAGPPIRVVLAVDDAGVRRRLRDVLHASHGDFEVVAATASCAGAQAFAHGHGSCVLVLALDLPGGPADSAIGAIRAESPDAEIIVLAGQSDAHRICTALRAGATGYVLLELTEESLMHAVRCAADGHGYLTDARVGHRGVPTGSPCADSAMSGARRVERSRARRSRRADWHVGQSRAGGLDRGYSREAPSGGS